MHTAQRGQKVGSQGIQRTPEELCRRRPANVHELLEVRGIGPRKAELYSREILTALKAYDRSPSE